MKIIATLKRFGVGDVRSYSGRGMNGKRCVGVDLDQPSDVGALFAECIRHAAENPDDAEELADMAGSYSQDSMGKGVIIYWPNIAWEGGDDDEEPCEECGGDWRDGSIDHEADCSHD